MQWHKTLENTHMHILCIEQSCKMVIWKKYQFSLTRNKKTATEMGIDGRDHIFNLQVS